MAQLTHDEARAWLAERLDWDLDPARQAALDAHLAACPACREADADYRRDRAALRQLRAPQPPRDLWARTAAALDREARRQPALPRAAAAARPRPSPIRPVPAALDAAGRRRRLRFGSAFASLTLLAIALVAGSQLLPGGLLAPGPNATPIALSPQPLAYIAVQGNQLVLVRSRLDHVCPPQAIDCSDLPAGINQIVAVPAQVDLSALAVDPLGEHAAVAGQEGNQTTFYVINLPPLPAVMPAASSGASGAGATLPAGASASAAVGATQGASPAPAGASPTASPVATGAPTAAAHSLRPSPTARRTASPTPTRSPGAAARTHQPGRASASPTAAPTKAGSGHLASPAPAGTGTPAGSGGTGTPEAAGGSIVPGGASAGPTASIPASGIPEIAVTQVILSNVVPTGLPAAWAPDGSTLAFSAMPADGSHGSDIYTWHPGDALAVPVTHDHDSYFASWVGSQIVGSNALAIGGDPLHLEARSFVIDLTTGQRRPLRLDNVWLPSVDPTGRFVAFWHGNLAGSGALPSMGQGELDFEQWSALDPFAQGVPAVTPTPAPSPAATAAHSAAPRHSPSPTPGKATASPRGTTASTPRGTASPRKSAGSIPAATPAGAGATSTRHERIPDLLGPTPSASPAVAPIGPQPIFPTGSPVASPLASGERVEGSGGPPAVSTAGTSAADTSAAGTSTAGTAPGAVAGTPAPEASVTGAGTPGASTASSGDEIGEAAPSGAAGSPAASPSASGEPTGALPSAGASAVIGDYAIAWASDGTALGVWRADTPGALDGLLSVFSIDPATGVLVLDPPFLGPTPAQRYFSMGRDRIAWTTPPDLSGSCQLHVMAWGPFGRGELRRSLDQQRLLTAF